MPSIPSPEVFHDHVSRFACKGVNALQGCGAGGSTPLEDPPLHADPKDFRTDPGGECVRIEEHALKRRRRTRSSCGKLF